MVLGAACLVGLIGSGINSICCVHAYTALEAGCSLLTQQTLHLNLLNQIIGGLVQMGKAVYLLTGQVGGCGHQILILRILCQLIGSGKGVQGRTDNRIIHYVLNLLAHAIQIQIQLAQGFDVLFFCHHCCSAFFLSVYISSVSPKRFAYSSASSGRNFGWATAIRRLARSRRVCPRSCATPYSVTI